MDSEKDPIVQSPFDKRQYRIVHLSNGLTAVLVHDPDVISQKEKKDSAPENGSSKLDFKRHCRSKLAAASMCVGVGAFSDEQDAKGVAHLLEHVLLMGTSEFPGEDDYYTFITSHGGLEKAETFVHFTGYSFKVDRMFLKPALKRFSQLFISPLLNEETLEREIEALDSEFHNHSIDEDDRLARLRRYTTVAGHPLNRIHFGNKESLKSNGINHIRAKTLDFFNKHYVGGNLKLAVIGGEPLDTLEQWVSDLFNDIRKGGPDRLTFPTGNIWEHGRIFWVEPIKDLQHILVSWSLPYLGNEYLTKPEKYLSYIFSQKGDGSLLSLLKRKGWATHMSLEPIFNDDHCCGSSIGCILKMKIELTALGLEKPFEVIGILYQYIKMLHNMGPQEWIFEEIQSIGNLEFLYQEDKSQQVYSYCLAKNVLRYPEKHIISGEYCYEKWDPKLISEILNFLNPYNMRVDILTKSFHSRGSRIVQYEPFYRVAYVIQNIHSTVLDRWKNPNLIEHELYLPCKNQYIPMILSIKSYHHCLENSESPKCFIEEDMIRIWYKEYLYALRTNACFILYLRPDSIALTELYVELLRDALHEVVYQAVLSKFNITIQALNNGAIELVISGFSENLTTLAKKIIETIKLFAPTEDRFNMIKEYQERKYRNYSDSRSDYLLSQSEKETEKKLTQLLSTTLSDINTHIREMFKEIFIEGLCHGKLSEPEVTDIVEAFRDTFKAALPYKFSFDREETVPQEKWAAKDKDTQKENDINSSVESYFQTYPTSIRNNVMADLFECIFYEPFFMDLRTKQQLGYDVTCGKWFSRSAVGVWFFVSSAKHSPLYLQDRISEFINKMSQILGKMDDNEFEDLRNTLRVNLSEGSCTPGKQADLYWEEIRNGKHFFEKHELEIDEVKKLQKSEVVDWYNSYLNPASSNCVRMNDREWGSNFPLPHNLQ